MHTRAIVGPAGKTVSLSAHWGWDWVLGWDLTRAWRRSHPGAHDPLHLQDDPTGSLTVSPGDALRGPDDRRHHIHSLWDSRRGNDRGNDRGWSPDGEKRGSGTGFGSGLDEFPRWSGDWSRLPCHFDS